MSTESSVDASLLAASRSPFSAGKNDEMSSTDSLSREQASSNHPFSNFSASTQSKQQNNRSLSPFERFLSKGKSNNGAVSDSRGDYRPSNSVQNDRGSSVSGQSSSCDQERNRSAFPIPVHEQSVSSGNVKARTRDLKDNKPEIGMAATTGLATSRYGRIKQKKNKNRSLSPARATRSNKLDRSISFDDSSKCGNRTRNSKENVVNSMAKVSSGAGSRAGRNHVQNSQNITSRRTRSMEMGGCVNPSAVNASIRSPIQNDESTTVADGQTELLVELVNCGKIDLRHRSCKLDNHEQFSVAIPSEKPQATQAITERHHIVETILAAAIRDSVSSIASQGKTDICMHGSNKKGISEKNECSNYNSNGIGNEEPSPRPPSGSFHYTDHGAVRKDAPLPEGVSRPGAYAGAVGQGYERLSSLHLAVSAYASNTIVDNEAAPFSTGEEIVGNPCDGELEMNGQEETADDRGDVEGLNFADDEIENVKTPTYMARHPATLGLLLMLLVGSVVIMIVVVSMVTRGESGGGSLAESSGETGNPTLGDKHVDQKGVNLTLLPDLPRETLEQFKDPTTPQSLAMIWLSRDSNREVYPDWRKLQRFAMATFFYAMGGESWPTTNEQARNWMNYSIPECDWLPYKGACTENGEVFWLQFSRLSGFRGSVPQEIQFMEKLSGMNFSNNILDVPLEVMLPLQMIALSSGIKSIHCAFCQLSGSIPSELGMVTSLQSLVLTGNSLTGSLPSEIGRVTLLRQLLLESNELVGNIPSEVGLLAGLTEMALNDNTITGPIPTEIGNLTNLQCLGINYNALTSTLPTTLGLLTSIFRIELRGNQLSGGLPGELGLLSRMSTLELLSNRLEGNIPTQLGAMASLKRLVLSRNALNGKVPTECGRMSSVIHFDIAVNKLTGTVPSELGLLTHMTLLSLEHNVITGTVPSDIKALTNLKTLLV